MKKLNLLYVLVLFVLLAGLMLAQGKGDALASPENTEIKIVIFPSINHNNGSYNRLQELAEIYEQKHQGISLKIERVYPKRFSFGTIYWGREQSVDSLLLEASRQGADIIAGLSFDHLPILAASNIVVSLDQEIWQEGLPAVTGPAMDAMGGQTLAVTPFFSSYALMFHAGNMEELPLKEAALASQKSWEEFGSLLHQQGLVLALENRGNFFEAYRLTQPFGVELIKSKKGKVSINREAVDRWFNLMTPPGASGSLSEVSSPPLAGNYQFLINEEADVSLVTPLQARAAVYYHKDLSLLPVPTWEEVPGIAPVWSDDFAAVVKGAKNEEIAKDFIAWLAGPEAAQLAVNIELPVLETKESFDRYQLEDASSFLSVLPVHEGAFRQTGLEVFAAHKAPVPSVSGLNQVYYNLYDFPYWIAYDGKPHLDYAFENLEFTISRSMTIPDYMKLGLIIIGLIFIILLIIMASLVRLIILKGERRRRYFSRLKALYTKGILILVVMVVFAGAFGYMGNDWTIVRNLEVPLEKMHEDEEQAKIVFLADLHAKNTPLFRFTLERALKNVEADAIVLGGDYVDVRVSDTTALKWLAGVIKDTGIPTYFILGDSDVYFRTPEGYNRIAVILEDAGFHNLQKTPARLADNIWLSNVQYYNRYNESSTDSDHELNIFDDPVWTQMQLDENIIIGVVHQPVSLLRYLADEPAGVYPVREEQMRHIRVKPDLILAAHTHGGQIRLPWYGAFEVLDFIGQKYTQGYYEENNMKMYVTTGLGANGSFPMHFRLFNPPEVTVVHLKPR